MFPSFGSVAFAVADLGTQPHRREEAAWLSPRLALLCRSYSQGPMDLILQMKLYNDVQTGKISVGGSKESAMRPYRDVLLRKDFRLSCWQIG